MTPLLEITKLDASRQPTDAIACTRCVNSMWFQTGGKQPQLKCYCQKMFLITWHTGMQDDEAMMECEGQMTPAPEPESQPQQYAPAPAAPQPAGQPAPAIAHHAPQDFGLLSGAKADPSANAMPSFIAIEQE